MVLSLRPVPNAPTAAPLTRLINTGSALNCGRRSDNRWDVITLETHSLGGPLSVALVPLTPLQGLENPSYAGFIYYNTTTFLLSQQQIAHPLMAGPFQRGQIKQLQTYIVGDQLALANPFFMTATKTL